MNSKRNNTDTTRFILPLLNLELDDVINDDFINAYIGTKDSVENDYQLILVYKQSQNKFLKYETIKNDYYLYYIPTTKLIKETIVLFINGQYSKFNNYVKKLILKFWKLDSTSRMFLILNPKTYIFEMGYSPTLVGKIREIWPKPSLDTELF